MLWQKLLLINLQIILALQLIAANSAEVDVDELKSQISSHLSYTARRLVRLQQDVDEKYAVELEQLLALYLKAANAEDPLIEEKQLLEYEGEQRQSFMAYLNLQYDEQFLNEDIRVQEWSMRTLMTEVSGALAEEIEKVLPAYESALKIVDFDQKYAAFTGIQETFSPELWQLIDAEPEGKAVLNVQLKFFKEFLLYLQKQDDARPFAPMLRDSLNVVEAALQSADLKEKLEVLDSFDDLTTKFRRYLDYKILEFQFDRFGQ
uniref:Probable ubiquitination network signaling protein acrB n=1 Tax=Zeugodacus cucurbitae TaxID=28588 RepID=A0A0A1XCH4_ZEUCU